LMISLCAGSCCRQQRASRLRRPPAQNKASAEASR
jgi:hypothetical protein